MPAVVCLPDTAEERSVSLGLLDLKSDVKHESVSMENKARPCGEGIEACFRVNLFLRLADLFPAEKAWHKPTDAARRKLLMQTLCKKYPNLESLVADFQAYVYVENNDDAQVKHFVDAIFDALSEELWKRVSSHVTGLLASIVLHINDALEILLLKCCKTNSPLLLHLLETTLTTSELGDLNNDKSILGKVCKCKKSLVEERLLFGESPLIHAVRNKSPGVTLLLLRFGANINVPWLRFQNAFEVLLFSPHAIQINQQQQHNIKVCLQYLCQAVVSIDLERLQALQNDDYFPFMDDWEALIPDDRVRIDSNRRPKGAICDPGKTEHQKEGAVASGSDSQGTNRMAPGNVYSQGVDAKKVVSAHKRSSRPATLSHLARCSIRSLIHKNGSLPGDIYSLPLPKLLLQYVDLLVD